MKEILELTPDQEALIKTYATIKIDVEGNETYTLNLTLKRDKDSKPSQYYVNNSNLKEGVVKWAIKLGWKIKEKEDLYYENGINYFQLFNAGSYYVIQKRCSFPNIWFVDLFRGDINSKEDLQKIMKLVRICK